MVVSVLSNLTILFLNQSQVKVTTFFINFKADKNKYTIVIFSYEDICFRYVSFLNKIIEIKILSAVSLYYYSE